MNIIYSFMKLLDGMIHSFVNIGYGIGIAVIISAILLVILLAITGGNRISPLSYLIAIILTPLLVLQLSLLFGAISVKGQIQEAEETINAYAQLLVWSENGIDSMEDVYDILNEFQSIVPGLTSKLGTLTIGQVDKNDIGGSLMRPAKSYINKYIFFRVLWSLIFSLSAFVGMLLLSESTSTSNYRKTSMHKERVSSRRASSGHRPSRRIRRY